MLRNSWFLKSAEIDFSWIFLITGYDVQCLEEGNNQEEDSNLFVGNNREALDELKPSSIMFSGKIASLHSSKRALTEERQGP